MSIHDAEPRDIYIDANGKLWRCTTVCKTPTVTFEEVEGRPFTPQHQQGLVGGGCVPQIPYQSSPMPLIRDRKNGGTKDTMWKGWKRIHRPA